VIWDGGEVGKERGEGWGMEWRKGPEMGMHEKIAPKCNIILALKDAPWGLPLRIIYIF